MTRRPILPPFARRRAAAVGALALAALAGTVAPAAAVQVGGSSAVESAAVRYLPAASPGDATASYDAKILELVNAERRKNGQGAVSGFGPLRDTAVEHSGWMARNTFEHRTNAVIQASINGAGCSSGWGENIHWSTSLNDPQNPVTRWMNSPAHKKNILRADMRYAAVGSVVSGGRVYNTLRLAGSCAGSGTAPAPSGATLATSSSFDGGWQRDVLARRSSTGSLSLYRGNGAGGWLRTTEVGSGWSGMDVVETVQDFDGDGRDDVIAREAATGYLWLYSANASGGWSNRVRIGSGWDVMSAILSSGDFDGDGNVDVLARARATGDMWLYPGNGRGGWHSRVRVGNGWSGMNAIEGVRDFNGDGTGDVVAREAGGRLVVYGTNGRGGWLPPVRFGTGWNAMSDLVGTGDFNGDGTADLLASEAATGTLWLYPGNGRGGWLPRVQAGSGWQVMDLVS